MDATQIAIVAVAFYFGGSVMVLFFRYGVPPENDEEDVFYTMMTFGWPLLLPALVAYRIYNKIKARNGTR